MNEAERDYADQQMHEALVSQVVRAESNIDAALIALESVSREWRLQPDRAFVEHIIEALRKAKDSAS